MKRALARAAIAPAFAATLAGCDSRLPPLPEVVVFADTDLPVPLAASRLRIDLYSEDGAWFESTDVARPDPRDWPASFGVYADDATRPRRVWVRLRAYRDGRVRDYRGENPHLWGGPIELTVPAVNAPRLVKDGKDVTPSSEPDPIDAVDRLLLLELEPDEKRELHVVLRGACLGVSARFGDDQATLRRGEAEGCVDTENTRVKVDIAAPETSIGVPASVSMQASWLAEPACPALDAASPRVCVAGGATVLGASDPSSSGLLAATPVRVLGLRRFFVDRREVTVARFRAAVAQGLMPEVFPFANDGPLTPTTTGYCTWSHAPLDREDYSLSCVSWATARAFCRFAGGDLPTEAQWEHATTIAGHPNKVRFPSGNADPTCDEAAFGRLDIAGVDQPCLDKGQLAPPPADSAGDLSPLGIIGLAGGLSEWALDRAEPYSAACWGDSTIVDPRCGDPDEAAPRRSYRGSSFLSPLLAGTARWSADAESGYGPLGFRCVYVEPAP